MKEYILEILTLISTGLWALYVYYTHRTFKEIKKQTNLYHGALLRVTPIINNKSIAIEGFSKAANDEYNFWKGLLEGNNVKYNKNPSHLELVIANRGRSDVISWQVFIEIEVESGGKIQNEIKRKVNWYIDSKISQYIPFEDNEDKIKIPIVLTNAFPKYIIRGNIKYSDIRNEEYTSGFQTFIGEM